MEQAFDRTTFNKINKYSSERIKELYARMILVVNSLPDFKTRLIHLQKSNGMNIPGFFRPRANEKVAQD